MTISMGLLMHWFSGLLLAAMATFALLEVKSASLIPKSLFLWPLMGLVFGLSALAAPLGRGRHSDVLIIFLGLGMAMTLCSLQAFLVNIRKISRWPSGAVWLSLVLVAMAYQIPYTGFQEPLFHTFFRRLTGFLWGAIGITKVLGERSAATEGGTPRWIVLLYVQAVLIASAPA